MIWSLPPDVIGPLGIRVMTVRHEQVRSPAYGSLWQLGWNEAMCLRGFLHVHEAPEFYCGCGFYGYTFLPGYLRTNGPDEPFQCMALVEAAGPLVLHQDGWRAAQARVLAIIPYPFVFQKDISQEKYSSAREWRHETEAVAAQTLQVEHMSVQHALQHLELSNRQLYGPVALQLRKAERNEMR